MQLLPQLSVIIIIIRQNIQVKFANVGFLTETSHLSGTLIRFHNLVPVYLLVILFHNASVIVNSNGKALVSCCRALLSVERTCEL